MGSSSSCVKSFAMPGDAKSASPHALPTVDSNSNTPKREQATTTVLIDEESKISLRTLLKRYPLYGNEKLMSRKKHGTSETPVQKNLRWGCRNGLADRICNYNRHYAEPSGYFQGTSFIRETKNKQVTFYDSNTGKPLFIAPKGRSYDAFIAESRTHGWPSFRDNEIVWENVRCLRNGEAVSMDGTHLGHNLPDQKGNRYCINLVSIAGRPAQSPAE